MHDEFKTIRSETRAETKIQASRFISTALPVTTKAEAEQFIAKLRKEFWDATHNSFAYRVGTEGKEFRFNDDGEPSGSAGKPILSMIDKFALTDVLVVVARYFGGTKLGVGGLARAYGDAAERALSNAEKLPKYITQIIEATFPHSHISNVMHVVSRLCAKIIDTQYDEDVHVQLEIRLSRVDELKSALVNQTKGNVSFKTQESS
jgi:uncharacterized YigZ family protein